MSKSLDKLAKENPAEWAKWNQTDPRIEKDASCPPPVPTPSDVANNITSTLEAAGIQSCSTDQASSQFSAQMQGSIMGMMQGNASVQASTNQTSTIGCEQVSAISNAYKQTVNNVTCTIKNNTTNIQNTQHAVNAIKIKAGGNILINCSGCTDPSTCGDDKNPGTLSFKQSINMKMMSTIQLSETDVASIANNTSVICKGITQMAQESTNGLGATPQGSKAIKTSTDTITQQNFNQAVTNSIKKINVAQNADNSITIDAGGNITIIGKQCTFNQDTVLEIIANAIVSDVVQKTMQNIATAINEHDDSMSQRATNAGAESLIKVAAPDQTSNPLYGLGGTAKMLMIGAIIIAVLGVAAVGMKGAGVAGKVAEAKIAQDSQMMAAAMSGGAGAGNPGIANVVGAAAASAAIPVTNSLVPAAGPTSTPSAPPLLPSPSTQSLLSEGQTVKTKFRFKAVKCIPVGAWIGIAFAIVLIIGVLVSLYLK